MKKLQNFFFKNTFAKIVCLALAVVLWIYVGTGQTKSAFYPGDIPLQIKNVPQGLVAITDTESVKAKIVADSDTFKKLSADSFEAYVDMAGYLEGVNEVKIVVKVNVANVTIVETNPAQVVVSLEPSIQKEVGIKALIDGKAGEGLVAGETKFDPAKVTVTGARSSVNSLLEATAKITLNGETSEFKKMVTLEGVNAQGKKMKGLIFSPNQAIATVSIIKASNVKIVGIKASITGTPSDGYYVVSSETDPKTVTISASDLTIGGITYAETMPIDVSGITKNTEFTTTLKVTPGLNILDDIKSIKVTVVISKSQASKELILGYAWAGLNTNNLTVKSVSPATIKITVSGAADVINKLSASDVIITVDLSSFSQPGTYPLDINRAMISTPAGVSVGSVVPSSINVQLDTK